MRMCKRVAKFDAGTLTQPKPNFYKMKTLVHFRHLLRDYYKEQTAMHNDENAPLAWRVALVQLLSIIMPNDAAEPENRRVMKTLANCTLDEDGETDFQWVRSFLPWMSWVFEPAMQQLMESEFMYDYLTPASEEEEAQICAWWDAQQPPKKSCSHVEACDCLW